MRPPFDVDLPAAGHASPPAGTAEAAPAAPFPAGPAEAAPAEPLPAGPAEAAPAESPAASASAESPAASEPPGFPQASEADGSEASEETPAASGPAALAGSAETPGAAGPAALAGSGPSAPVAAPFPADVAAAPGPAEGAEAPEPEDPPESGLLERLRKEALALPASPGVYLMKDSKGKIIYVGKAKILPRRVSSYFRAAAPTARIGLMVGRVRSFGFMVTNTEKEALILENSLIKKHRPRFNVLLRDDKTYPSLRLSVTDPFPRLEIVRRPARDGSIIYGPFPSSGALAQTLKMVSRLFPLRRCRRPDVKKTPRPCLNFQLGLCCGPCRPEFTPEEYAKITDGVRLFFRGRREELLKDLRAEMKRRAEAFEFEAAAVLRDRAHDLERTLERQLVASLGD
ncbi:MAG: GIY-YIG nuclease family protein, partial [Deltaproteobacteria bacterium]|nr:GIY-YIG nuclease family protein [Deltaproteobacteria bacterium]